VDGLKVILQECRRAPPYTLRRDGKSAEVIERKADTRGPLRKRVRKSLKAKGLNKGDGKDFGVREHGLGIMSVLEYGTSRLSVNKHGEEYHGSTLRVNYFLSIIRMGP
jgi:hypothetical protein